MPGMNQSTVVEGPEIGGCNSPVVGLRISHQRKHTKSSILPYACVLSPDPIRDTLRRHDLCRMRLNFHWLTNSPQMTNSSGTPAHKDFT